MSAPEAGQSHDIGILIAAHQDLGAALLRAAEGIVGPMERVEALALHYDEAPDAAGKRLAQALKRLEGGAGVLILTDLFGGTATNLSLPHLEEGRVEILAGVNLPLLLKGHAARNQLQLGQLARLLKDYGAQNIILASDFWKARPK